MKKLKPVILTAIICAVVFSAVSFWIFEGDWPFLPYLLLAGFFIILVQKETATYKFLDKLLVGSLLFSFLAVILIFSRMYIISRWVYNSPMPLHELWSQERFMMAVVFSIVSFLGGLLGIVLKGFYSLYKNKLDKVIIFLGPLILAFSSLSILKVKIGGTIMSSLYGWPYPFFVYQVKDVLDGFTIDKLIFSPGSLYHYIVFDYLFYLIIFFLAYYLIKLINKKLENKKLNITIFLFGWLVLLIIGLTSFLSVKQSYISYQIAKAGDCKADADCVIVANKSPFSCAIVANKNNSNRILNLVNSFPSTGELSCSGREKTACLQNKCQISIDQTPADSNGEQSAKIEAIKAAFLEKYPSWESLGFAISIEENSSGHAMGTVTWPNLKGAGFWFAAKINNQWLITDYGGENYFGICQNFQKYNFPSEMISDCWDEEKNIMINTPNPARFYNGLTTADKDGLKQAFIKFMQDKSDNNYQDEELFVKFGEHIDRYLKGTILISGSENYSAPQFLTVKVEGNWIIVYYGQENPPCENIAPYNFPVSMISDCWDGEKWVKRK